MNVPCNGENSVMSESDNSVQIKGLIDRLQAGDDGSARADLLACVYERLGRLTRKMLQDFPVVQRWEESSDIVQNAAVRLDRALKAVTPPSSKDFFRLAAALIRRELIDLSRHHKGPEGLDANYESHSGVSRSQDSDVRRQDPSASTYSPQRLASWTEFRSRIESLPDEDQEMFDLLWYQGLTQAEAAEILKISERQVNRRWIAARAKLIGGLGNQVPF
jgi:RNA polymerase sigma-70 factor (ECF subfamily)